MEVGVSHLLGVEKFLPHNQQNMYDSFYPGDRPVMGQLQNCRNALCLNSVILQYHQ